MAALDFPSNPSTGTVYVGSNDVTYVFDGVKWLGQSQKGFQGFQGIAGPQGEIGAQGLQGVQGAIGLQGFQGVQGATGTQGATGAQGAQGDLGFQGAQGDLGFQGFRGFQGLVGEQGSQGISGADNLTFISGTGTQVTKVLNTVTIWSTHNLQTITSEGNSTNLPITIFNDTQANNTTSGALIVTGGVGIGGNLNLGKILTLTQIQESFVNISGASGVVNHDSSSAKIFNHTNIANTFTVNLTNFTLDSGFSTVVVLILNQGNPPQPPSALQINGTTSTVTWQGGSSPAGTISGTDVISYTILNNGGIYRVLGQLVPFG
jgi:hypothetical protein